MASISSLAEFETALSTVEWLVVINNFSTTGWCTDRLPQWALGSAYSQHKTLLLSTPLTTYAGTNFYEPVLQGALHYTLQEVPLILTLAAGCVCTSANRSGLWKREDIVQEFAWADRNSDVTGWGEGSVPLALAIGVLRDLIPSSSKAPMWSQIAAMVRPFSIIPNSVRKSAGRLRLVRAYMLVLDNVTGSLSPMKGQADLPDHFDPATVAALQLRSSNTTSRFVPLLFPPGRLPIWSLPCPEDDPEDSAMVAVQFDCALHKAKVKLSGTPVRLQCHLISWGVPTPSNCVEKLLHRCNQPSQCDR